MKLINQLSRINQRVATEVIAVGAATCFAAAGAVEGARVYFAYGYNATKEAIAKRAIDGSCSAL